MRISFFGLVFLTLCQGCILDEKSLFTDITEASGVEFENALVYTPEFNPYTYRNFFNGAGVALGDLNNDGLLDVYFTGNQVGNKLFINEGNLKFKDVTSRAGVGSLGSWSTGVTMVDVNADGYLDIYVCKSGPPATPHRHNELFINNGDLTFTEKAAEFGLDVVGLSVQAAFFDYDRDGDLDCYLLTNSFKSVGNFDFIKDQRNKPDSENGGNKFFTNDNGKYRDFTNQAGIYNSSIGFGLGITLGDFNDDAWVDIFVSNDFYERDYLYINNQKGAFVESLPQFFESISAGSMGADFADLDNDGINELFVTEMLPDSLARKKTKIQFETWDKFQQAVNNGYHYQFARNTLQKKISIGDSSYKEVGRMAGIAATEWSWGALLFDMDNDGLRDIFVSNGIYKDLLDRDYLSFSESTEAFQMIRQDKKNGIIKLIEAMPSSRFVNYAYHNQGNMRFNNLVDSWGLNKPMYSSGSAYGDLDNDGDLDLVVSNINSPSVVYRNNTDTSKNKSIRFDFSSISKNRFMLGTVVQVFANGRVLSGDNYTVRGYQSSVQPWITLGLGDTPRIDSAIVYWPNGEDTILYQLTPNEAYALQYKANQSGNKRRMNRDVKSICIQRIDTTIRHRGVDFSDFNRDRLLPMMYGNESPSLVSGDVNLDGVDEVYMGGGSGQDGVLMDLASDSLKKTKPIKFDGSTLCEETAGTFFDADGDGDLDFYFANGGRLLPPISSGQKDMILLNVENGRFEPSKHALPLPGFATSFAEAFDFDHDGDQDLFVAERYNSFTYGLGGRGFLLQNNGEGLFNDVTTKYAPEFAEARMITDGLIVDFDNDGWKDILLVGDWMPIVVFKNYRGLFTNVSKKLNLLNTEGWWNVVKADDLNKDGVVDFVLGNHGRNSFFMPGDRMYIHDFDKNGSTEQIYCTSQRGKYYPVLDKDELLSQIPSLKKTLIFYKDYKDKTMTDIFQEEVLSGSKILEVKYMSSVMLLSGPTGYSILDLPSQAQYAPVYALLLQDIDNDDVTDLIVGGNQFKVKPQFGRFDASDCFLFRGQLRGKDFRFLEGESLGIKGEVRDIKFINNQRAKLILFAKYDDNLEIFKICD